MNITADHIILILCMCLVTYIPRAAPLMLLSGRSLNRWVEKWLGLVPPAVLAAILAPALLITRENGAPALSLGPDNFMLIAAVPAFLTAWFAKSFLGTVLVGMVSVALLRYFL